MGGAHDDRQRSSLSFGSRRFTGIHDQHFPGCIPTVGPAAMAHWLVLSSRYAVDDFLSLFLQTPESLSPARPGILPPNSLCDVCDSASATHVNTPLPH